MADGGKVRHLFINEAGSGGGEPAKYYQLTLPATGWIGDKPPYRQELIALQLSGTDVPICDLAEPDLDNIKEFNKLIKIQSITDRLVISANEKTIKDIKINFLCVAAKDLNRPVVKPTLEDYSWNEIASISNLAQTDDTIWDNYNFHIGDTKKVSLSGEIGYTNITGEHYFFILDFNHNKEIEGGGITFCCGTTQNKDKLIVLYDIGYMGPSKSSVNWEDSYFFKNYCPSFFNTLPKEIQRNIKTVDKHTGAKNGEISITKNQIFIPSEYEVFGMTKYSNQKEAQVQTQYDYFKINDKNGYAFNDQSLGAGWFLRSLYDINYNAFIEYNGNIGYSYGNINRGFLPCFVI